MTATKIVTKHVTHTGRLMGYQFTADGPFVACRDDNGKRRKLTDRYLRAKGYSIRVQGPLISWWEGPVPPEAR